MNEHASGTGIECRGGCPAEVTPEQYEVALARARAYLGSALEMRERARIAEEVASARMRSAERTLRIARQVLARLQMLGRQFETN